MSRVETRKVGGSSPPRDCTRYIRETPLIEQIGEIMAKHLITSKKIPESVIQMASLAGASIKIQGKRPTGRQGKIRSARVNPTSQKRKTG